MTLRAAAALGLALAAPGAFAQHVHPAATTTQSQPPDTSHAGHPTQAPARPAPAAPAPAYRPPALSDADRAAAFPDLHGHDMRGHMDDDPFVWMATAERVEWRQDEALAWEANAWFGRDRGRLWLRSEGERERGHGTEAHLEALWGTPVDPWWDLLAGVRHDVHAGGREWLALGVQGLAPYKFEVQATAYVGTGAQLALEGEAEYELLLTNRLILQPRVEATWHRRTEQARGIGGGLGEVEAGLRLRYELRREFAPYIGIERARRFGRTAALARAAGDEGAETRWVAGLRFWF